MYIRLKLRLKLSNNFRFYGTQNVDETRLKHKETRRIIKRTLNHRQYLIHTLSKLVAVHGKTLMFIMRNLQQPLDRSLEHFNLITFEIYSKHYVLFNLFDSQWPKHT